MAKPMTAGNVLRAVVTYGGYSKADLIQMVQQTEAGHRILGRLRGWTRGELLAYVIEHYIAWE